MCQDALYHSNWTVADAIIYLNKNCVKRRKFVITPKLVSNGVVPAAATVTAETNGNTTDKPMPTSSSGGGGGGGGGKHSNNNSTKFKKKRRESEDRSDVDDADGAYGRGKERVYNSDDEEDSDYEQKKSERSYHMTKDRRNVFDFINTAKHVEFQSVRGCTARKIDMILELRPFSSWINLIQKIQGHKYLSTDLLNACQDFLARRNNMAKIMLKCTRIVERLEKAVALGGGLRQQPSNLNPEYKLADYQLIGLNWLAVMNKEEMNGILADEMGLGKTIQVIAFLAYLKEAGLAKNTHLVVVPSSTLENWVNEFERWCPEMVVEKYYGGIEERRSMRIRYAKSSFAGIDVLLTTYHTVGSSPEERKMFRVSKLQYVIFDEAHMLKNMTTIRYTNLFRINAERRLLLTGTPLQNNLLELMSLLCFVMPSMFSGNTDDIKALFQKNVS